MSNLLHIKLAFPYNWYQLRKVGVYDDKGHRLIRIGHCGQESLVIPNDTVHLVLKLDYFKSEIPVPKSNGDIFMIVYLDFRDSFPVKYFDVLRRRCLTGKFVDKDTFERFNLDFYTKAKKRMQKSKPDVPNLLLGALISLVLIFYPSFQQNSNYTEIILFIGVVSLISLFMIYIQREKLLLYDYKSRVIATGVAFLMATFLLQGAPFYITGTLLVFSITFLLSAVKKESY